MRKKKRVKPAQLVFFRENWVEPAQPGTYEKTKRVEPAAPEFYQKKRSSRLHPIFSKKNGLSRLNPNLMKKVECGSSLPGCLREDSVRRNVDDGSVPPWLAREETLGP